MKGKKKMASKIKENEKMSRQIQGTENIERK